MNNIEDMTTQPEALRLADRLDLKDYYEFDAGLHCPHAAAELRRQHAEIAALKQQIAAAPEATFKIGDRVTKISGSSWTGRVVGTYSTSLTPEGYAVESETEKGSVQIYPAKALAAAPAPEACRADGRCQYAIDHGAEGLGHCPKGKCCMPKPEAAAIRDILGQPVTLEPMSDEEVDELSRAAVKGAMSINSLVRAVEKRTAERLGVKLGEQG